MKMTSIQTTHRRQKMTTMAYRFRHPLNPPQTGTIAFLLIVQALHLLMGNRSSAPASLNTPLLPLPHEAMVSSSSSPSAATLEWPEEVAERVRLLVPHEYDPYQRDGPKMCMIRFHKEHKKFTIVAEETEETLDIIDPDDAIGVSIEIEMLDAASILVEPREEYVSPSPEQEGNNRASNEPASDTPVDTQGTAVLTIFAYPKRDACNKSTLGSCGWKNKPNPITEFSIEPEETTATAKPKNLGNRQQHHRRFTVAPTEDFADLSRLVSAMRNIIHGNKNVLEERRLLVIINPVSGRGNAQEVYQKIVMPIFEEASVPFDSLVTSYSRHAEERMRQLPKNGDIRDLSEYSGIVAIGGDGLVHEIMQGIHNRQDAKEIFKNVKLGMIGAGTSNGLSASLAHASEEKFSQIDNAFMIAKGKTAWMDLSRYETRTNSYTSFLTFSWGYIADIDIESEAIRFMGFLRMDIWGAWRVLNLRKYRAKFSYLPPTGDRQDGVTLPPLDEPLPQNEGWITCEDDFILFWASQVTHAGEQMFHAPNCKIDDGVFNIFIVRGNVSRIRLALIALAMEHGGHIDMPGAEFIECTAYRLEPITTGSFNDLDGEVIEPGPVQAAVIPHAIRAFCNP